MAEQATETRWRNRIVRSGDAPLAEITANPKNWRGDGSTIERIQVERYHRFKAENGYTADEIDRKRLALEGVQVPITAPWNVELLRGAGFREIDCFWRWENFGAWLAVKSS